MVDSYLIQRGARVRDAMRQLEEVASKTVFVVDPDRSLFGTLTDGDVRRWILSGGDLDGLVERVCNTAPFMVAELHDMDTVRQEMLDRRISCVPVVDGNRQIREVLLWEKVFSSERAAPGRKVIDLPVVVMAGGAGTRLAPFTTVLPKPLIPLGGKTVIELIVDSFTSYGVADFYLSLNYKSKIIKSYFEELAPPYNVHYIYEDKPLGTAGSLYQLAGRLQGDLIVTNCDVIVRADYAELVAHHRRDGNDLTLVASLKHYSIPYGVCEIENGGRLREIREKPEYNFLVNTGLYVLRSSVLDSIPPNQFFHITDLIAKLQAGGGKIGVYPISDKAWIDTGEWEQYRNAVAELTGNRHGDPV